MRMCLGGLTRPDTSVQTGGPGRLKRSLFLAVEIAPVSRTGSSGLDSQLHHFVRENMSVELPSLVVCGPQLEEIPDATYLARLRSSLLHDPYLRSLKQEALELHEMWPLLSATEPSLARFDAAPLLHSFAEWIRTGDSHVLRLAGGTLRNTQLALLTVLAHLLEYTTYLQHRHHHDHAQSEHAVLTAVHDGGVQGLSIGVLSAIAISCSQSRMHLARYGAIALRLAVCAGAWKDLDEMHAAEPPVCLEARWEGGGARAFKAVLDSYPQVGASSYRKGAHPECC